MTTSSKTTSFITKKDLTIYQLDICEYSSLTRSDVLIKDLNNTGARRDVKYSCYPVNVWPYLEAKGFVGRGPTVRAAILDHIDKLKARKKTCLEELAQIRTDLGILLVKVGMKA